MILAVNIDLGLAQADPEYQVVIPTCCPKCGGKIWRHGTVLRWFTEILQQIRLPRIRCLECKAVTTVRPATHRPRHQTALYEMGRILAHRLKSPFWPPGTKRQKAGHWLKRFRSWLHMRGLPDQDPSAELAQALANKADFLS